MNKIIILATILLCSFQVYAESYSDVSTIKGMTAGVGKVRVQLNSMKVVEGCTSTKFYYLDTSISKDMYTALLTANASGQKVSLQLTGCSADMAVITHVYICDAAFCS